MRLIFMLLVLANLGLLAWIYWHDDEAVLPEGRDGSSGPTLVLLEEAGEQEASQRDPTPPVAETDDVPRLAEPVATRCASIGPFDSAEQAAVAVERLAEIGINAKSRESGGQIRAGFWVYLPPFASRNAAIQTADELRARGVIDLFVVTAPEQRNAISLGLFSTPDRADQRAAEIGRLGYSPRVAERFREAVVYWLDFREDPGAPLEPEAIGIPAVDGTVAEKREIPCDSIAVTRPRA